MSEAEIISAAMKLLGPEDQKLLREILLEPHEPGTREQMEADLDYLRKEKIKKEFKETTAILDGLELSSPEKKSMEVYRRGCLRALKAKGVLGRKLRYMFCLGLADFERDNEAKR